MSGKTRLSIASLGVIAAIGILFAVLPAIGSSHGEVIRLRLDSSTSALTYGSATQPLTTTRCQIDNAAAAGNLVNISATNRGPGLVDGIGVKSGGSNGTPCSFADSTETLAFTAPSASDGLSPVAGRNWVKLRLDVEAKGNAWIVAELYDGSALVDTHELVTGSSIAQYNFDNGTSLVPNPGPPYTAETNGSPVAACASASDSGPDSGINDNCLWTIIPSQAFNRVEITTLVGEVSIEGGGDYEGIAGLNQVDYETWFYLNSAPVAQDDGYTVVEDETIVVESPGILGNDEDADVTDGLSQVLTAELVLGPTSASSFEWSADGSFTYTPNADFNGTDNFTYTASDGSATSNVATVTITVIASNDPPAAKDDLASTEEDSPVDVDVLANDTDVDSGDILAVASVTQGANGTVVNNGTDVTYTPNADYNGTDTFSYVASDGNGGTATATVTVTVNATNDAPVALGSEQSVGEDGSLTLAPSQLGSDPDCDVSTEDPDCTGLTLSIVTGPNTGPENGTVVIDESGNIVYTPDPDFNGSDFFTYEVCDLSTPVTCSVETATVIVTVLAAADNDIAYIDVPEEPSVVIDVLANDGSPSSPLFIYNGTGTAGAGFTIPTEKGGSAEVEVDANGYQTVRYTPPAVPLLFESDSFQYEVWDGTEFVGFVATVTVFELFDCGETLSVSEGGVTASYTRAAEADCEGKPYVVDVTSTLADDGETSLPTVLFQPRPQVGEPVPDCSADPSACTAEFTAELSFVPRAPTNGPNTGVLEYDPVVRAEGENPAFRDMLWCTDTPDPMTPGSITSVLPRDTAGQITESWCIYEVTTIIDPDDPTTTRTLWKAAGIGDPLKRVS